MEREFIISSEELKANQRRAIEREEEAKEALMKSYIENNSDIIEKFTRAVNKGLEYVGTYIVEVTYNGNKNEWYLDAYKKFENKVIKIK